MSPHAFSPGLTCALLFLALGTACERNDPEVREADNPDAKATVEVPPEADPSAAPGEASIDALLDRDASSGSEGQRVRFDHGVARRVPAGVEVILSSAAVDCSSEGPGPGATWLRAILPPGPPALLFGGRSLGVGVSVEAPGIQNTQLDAYEAEVELREGGEGRVVGELRFDSNWLPFTRGPMEGSIESEGSGSFDLPVCEGASWPDADANELAQTPFSGTLKGTAVGAGSVLAIMPMDRSTQIPWLSELIFYAEPGVTCEQVKAHNVEHARLVLVGIGHGDAFTRVGDERQPQTKLEQPQPARPELLPPGVADYAHPRDGSAWLQLDGLPYTQGASLQGRARVSLGADRAEGSFTATVCTVGSGLTAPHPSAFTVPE